MMVMNTTNIPTNTLQCSKTKQFYHLPSVISACNYYLYQQIKQTHYSVALCTITIYRTHLPNVLSRTAPEVSFALTYFQSELRKLQIYILSGLNLF